MPSDHWTASGRGGFGVIVIAFPLPASGEFVRDAAGRKPDRHVLVGRDIAHGLSRRRQVIGEHEYAERLAVTSWQTDIGNRRRRHLQAHHVHAVGCAREQCGFLVKPLRPGFGQQRRGRVVVDENNVDLGRAALVGVDFGDDLDLCHRRRLRSAEKAAAAQQQCRQYAADAATTQQVEEGVVAHDRISTRNCAGTSEMPMVLNGIPFMPTSDVMCTALAVPSITTMLPSMYVSLPMKMPDTTPPSTPGSSPSLRVPSVIRFSARPGPNMTLNTAGMCMLDMAMFGYGIGTGTTMGVLQTSGTVIIDMAARQLVANMKTPFRCEICSAHADAFGINLDVLFGGHQRLLPVQAQQLLDFQQVVTGLADEIADVLHQAILYRDEQVAAVEAHHTGGGADFDVVQRAQRHVATSVERDLLLLDGQGLRARGAQQHLLQAGTFQHVQDVGRIVLVGGGQHLIAYLGTNQAAQRLARHAAVVEQIAVTLQRDDDLGLDQLQRQRLGELAGGRDGAHHLFSRARVRVSCCKRTVSVLPTRRMLAPSKPAWQRSALWNWAWSSAEREKSTSSPTTCSSRA